MKELHTRQGRHLEDVQSDHSALRTQRLPHPLRPAAGRRAEIDHDHAGLEQAVALDEFLQLVGGTRTQALGLGLLHEGIGKVFLEPAMTAFAAGGHGSARPGGVWASMIPCTPVSPALIPPMSTV